MDVATHIKAIAVGDRAAFTRLYRSQQRTMLAYATGLLAGDSQAAEDAVDEAFFDIWKSASSYAGHGDAQGWIRRIVRNKAIDWIRKSKSGATIVEDVAQVVRIDPAANPEERARANSEANWLRKNLLKLNVEQREAVILCYYEDRPLAEIARIAGCPENTVKTRLFHARRHLRAAMALAEAG